MKCDKCGFEHNSRSTCPKCGASVIYVNEDYERRKREWEEAQKSGKGSVIPPGIMHSTKEEHDIRTGKDRMIHVKQEGGSEMTGLSFAVIKEKFIKFIAKIIVWFGKHKKKRGANNPVIRKLEFDNTPDTLDTSKLVLSHKIFKDNRKWFIIAGIIIIVLGVGIPVTIYNIKRIDRSDIIYVSENGIFSVNDNKPLLQTDNITFAVKTASDSFLAATNDSLIICKAGKISTVEINNPEVIAYNDNLSALIISSNHSLYFYDGRLNETGIAADDIDGKGCMVSDNGNFFAITTMDDRKDDVIYDMYYGDRDKVSHLSSDDRQKIVLDIYDDGSFLYLDMSNAEYGIVNDRAITYFDGNTSKVITSNLVEYRYVDDRDLMYYTDNEGYLYLVDNMETIKIDNEVSTFCDNMCDDKIFYLKDDGCYLVEKDSDYKIPLFKTTQTEITIYYNNADNYLYYSDMNGIYFVAGLKKGKTGTKVCDITYGDKPLWDSDNKKLYAVDAAGTFMELGISQFQIDSGVSGLLLMKNSEGYSYVKNNTRYIVHNDKKTVKMSDSDYSLNWSEIMYSKKYSYFVDENNRLYKASSKNGSAKSVDDVKICIFVD